MTSKRRHLMFAVMDGDMRIGPYLHHFDKFIRCDEMLKWLVDARLTGKQFMAWAQGTHGRSMLEVSREILMRLEKSKVERPVLLGRDLMTM